MSKRTAAALMITRGDGAERTVFLAERSPELRFFGGYWAMPGGTLSDSDLQLEPQAAAASRAPDRDAADPRSEDQALQVCAHRELFEELGLLRHRLPAERTADDGLRQLRQQLLAHELAERTAKKGARSQTAGTQGTGDGLLEPLPPPCPWPDIIAGTTTPLPLRELCRIETPAFAPVRYDTVFYHVPLEDCVDGTAGVHPDIWDGELTQGRFWLPEQALASWRNGDLMLVPPVVIMLEHLARAADFEHFAQNIAGTANGYRSGRLHKVRFSPGIVLAPLRTPTLPPATTTNCYLVGHEKIWIIDPGSPDATEQQRLLDLLDELTANGQELAGVLLTHHHPDHTGGVLALCQARNLKAYGHPETLARLHADVPRGGEVLDGDHLELGRAPDGTTGWTLQAIFTPGHDRGHLCFRESRYGAMIAGDMLSTVSSIIIDPPEGHLRTYLNSLERLQQFAMSTLYPAHGPALRDGQRLVAKYLRHRRQREAVLTKTLGELSSASIEELLPKVYWDADPRLYPFAARSLQAGLDKLVEDGVARLFAEDGDNAAPRWQLQS
ncbi:MAG: MBL fold metallo-hydrolase [Planctomycetota bacterium]